MHQHQHLPGRVTFELEIAAGHGVAPGHHLQHLLRLRPAAFGGPGGQQRGGGPAVRDLLLAAGGEDVDGDVRRSGDQPRRPARHAGDQPEVLQPGQHPQPESDARNPESCSEVRSRVQSG
jgi:hypothetical protein